MTPSAENGGLRHSVEVRGRTKSFLWLERRPQRDREIFYEVERQGFQINIERSFDPAAGKVDVFPQEITRALLNLISNGFYAATKRKEQDSSDEAYSCG